MTEDRVRRKFRLDQALRQGSAGSSWLARDREDGRSYVLKIVAAESVPSLDDLGARLDRLSEPLHPGLVRPYQWFAGERDVAIWRPHVEGADSGILCRAPLDRILATAQRVAEALHGAHARGLAHGALKPGNVIVDPERGARIVDFAPCPSGGPEQDVMALGELLYRWLTGAAPEATRDLEALAARLRDQLRADLNVPPPLGRLVVAMLAPEPVQRPASMLEIRDRVDDARLQLAGNRPQTLQEQWAAASFRPPPAAPDDGAPAAAAPARRGRRRTPIAVALALVVLLAAIITVVHYLPQRVAQERPEATVASPTPEAAPPPAPAPLTEAQLEALLQQRETAQSILDEFINLQLELKEQQVELWAERASAAAIARARDGDVPFRRQEFELAGEIYAEALAALEAVAALRPEVVADALGRGVSALDAADSARATEAFSLALAIEPDNEAATRGLERAQVLDEVVALVAQAEAAEQAGDLTAARDHYAKVLKLDAETGGVADALARVEAALVERAFRGAMSRALAALQRGDFEAAEAQFARADAIRPGARAVIDGRIELKRRVRDHEIATLEARAARAVAEERWEAARIHYAEMLARDPNLLLAQQGLRQASEREALDRRLESFIGEPSSWWSDGGRSEAASLLYDARATAAPGPRLSAQIERLERQLALAEQPVEVTLISDQACDVVVYKIARLGRFESTRLRLLPGRYTAVGTRDGYRDVRRDFLVAAGGKPEPVSLRCEEQVFAGGP